MAGVSARTTGKFGIGKAGELAVAILAAGRDIFGGTYMTMTKRMLLGSAAALTAIASAQAADLPVKARPVEYVKICSLYGEASITSPEVRSVSRLAVTSAPTIAGTPPAVGSRTILLRVARKIAR